MAENEETKDIEQTETQETTKEETPLDVLSEGMDKLFNEEVIDSGEQLETEDSDTEKVDDSEVKSEDETSQEKTTEEELEPIPQNQVDIARKLGFSDEDIRKLAEDAPDRLERMEQLYTEPSLPQRETPKVDVQKDKVEKREPPKLDHIKIDDLGDLEPESAKIVSKILETTNTIIDSNNELRQTVSKLGEHAESIDTKEKVEAGQRIDNFFDESTEFIPEVGTTSTLTPSQARVRSEVYGMAVVLQNTRGISEKEAMGEAANLWALSKVDLNKIDAEAEERVKEKLNKNKKRMSPKPGGKKKEQKEKLGKDAALDHLSKQMKEMLG